ncbi:uncharacterized protein EI90DRAFT_3041335 [Cantharellus anzutake]|uniref:uncharacterized protein n=1 Tax=Cantharellus anzutake TaxID=1750568 RepID=UPI001904D65E|nr:uncharacterized protein EI90DRAFT_3041335 [Cantharellus anzutake]KAF8338021.1 hypothetical protein EI90DRAFT_3041335 [Cantharellus anzutake]
MGTDVGIMAGEDDGTPSPFGKPLGPVTIIGLGRKYKSLGIYGEGSRRTETITESKTITTTTTEIIEEITWEYEVYDRETQTSIERTDHNLSPDEAPEVTHIRAEWATFKDFILRDFHAYADVDLAAKYTAEGATFRKLLKHYKEACEKEGRRAAESSADPSGAQDGDFRQRLLDMMNWCAAKGPERGIARPYQNKIKWVLSSHDDTHPTRCLGVEDPGFLHTMEEVCRWSDVLVVMDIQSSLPKQMGAPLNADIGESSRVLRKRSYGEEEERANDSPRKRLRTGDSETMDISQPIGSPLDNPETPSSGLPLPTADDKLSQYAMEAFSALGNRRHVLGILVAGTKVQFRYYDRAGTISSTDIELEKDAQEFAAAVMCFSLMTPQLLGRELLFTQIPKSAQTNSPFGTLTGAKIRVDGLKFEIDKPVYVSRALFGRGTAVYRAFNITDHPPIDDEQADDGAYSFEEKGEIYKPGEGPLHSHDEEEEYEEEGNEVEGVRNKSPPGRKRAPKVVIIKLSWQPVDCDNEAELLKDARKGQEPFCTPHLFATRVGGKLSDYDRRFNLPDPLTVPGQFADRVLRVQVVGPVLRPLYTCQDNWKEVLLSILDGHHELFENLGILHRDISVNNLMYDPNEPEYGYLIDLDRAERVMDVETKTMLTRNPCPPVGTKAFLSIELCTDKPVLHLYRHDLESFFYVLAWLLSRYRDGKRTNSQAFSEWGTGDWDTVKKQKQSMFSSEYKYPEDVPSWATARWLIPLGKLFEAGYAAKEKAVNEGTLADFDDETLGGHVTFDGFNAVLHRDD